MGYEEIKDKKKLMEKYSKDYSTLVGVIDGLTEEAVNYVPPIGGAWSIKEHICHLVDTEINGYLRFRKAILNPGATIDVGGGDMEKSNVILGYPSQDLNDSLELFRLIRKLLSNHTARINAADFDKYYIEHVNHPTFTTCTLGFILSIHTQHFDKHLEYIKRNISLFQKQKSF